MKGLFSVLVSILLLISMFSGCKKSQEELEKERVAQNKDLLVKSINSVYNLESKDLAYLVDPENAKNFDVACFDFRPKDAVASAKFYGNPEIYRMEVVTVNELEYKLIYKGKEALLRLELNDSATSRGSILSADSYLTIPGDKARSRIIGTMEITFSEASQRVLDNEYLHRTDSLTACEKQVAKQKQIEKESENFVPEGTVPCTDKDGREIECGNKNHN